MKKTGAAQTRTEIRRAALLSVGEMERWKIMEKQKVTVRLAGRNYTLVSSEAPEYMQRVADYVDRKLNETAQAVNLPSAQAAILTCMNLGDELMKSQDEISMLRRRLEEAMAEKE